MSGEKLHHMRMEVLSESAERLQEILGEFREGSFGKRKYSMLRKAMMGEIRKLYAMANRKLKNEDVDSILTCSLVERDDGTEVDLQKLPREEQKRILVETVLQESPLSLVEV